MPSRLKVVDFDAIWEMLKVTMDQAMKLNSVPKDEWADSVWHVYQLCVAHPESLANRLFTATKEFLANHLREVLTLVTEEPTHLEILKSYHFQWKRYDSGLVYLQELFSYMNSQYAGRPSSIRFSRVQRYRLESEFMETRELGLELWKSHMLLPLKDVLLRVLFDCVEKDRIGVKDILPDEMVKDVFSSFVWVDEYQRETDRFGLYQPLVEVRYEEATRSYCHQLSIEWLRQYPIQDYTGKAFKVIEEEVNRCKRFLCSSSFPVIEKCAEDGMIRDHLQILLEESKKFIEEEDTKAMESMSMLLRVVPEGITQFITLFRIHMEAEGLDMMRSLSASNQLQEKFVQAIFDFHEKYSSIIAYAFCNDDDYVEALDRACAFVTNNEYSEANKTDPCELLAKHCDQMVRQLTKQQLECKANVAMIAFKYIQDKDLFQKYYSFRLAKRLLYSTGCSRESEQLILDKFKQTCGIAFTYKLHKMMTDARLSVELTEEFKSIEETTNGYNFSLTVLQQGTWPMTNPCGIVFSAATEIGDVMRKFELFYRQKFVERKLIWAPEFSTVEVGLKYLKIPYVLTMQAFQLTVLLTFDENNSLTCANVSEVLGLEPQDFVLLLKHIKPLLEVGVITASDTGLDRDTVLELNMSFKSRTRRIRVKNITQTEEESQSTPEPIDNKQMFLQAALVRIMKARKIMQHADLVCLLLQQCDGFVPNKTNIKKAIESLIDRQYIERMPDNHQQYIYVS